MKPLSERMRESLEADPAEVIVDMIRDGWADEVEELETKAQQKPTSAELREIAEEMRGQADQLRLDAVTWQDNLSRSQEEFYYHRIARDLDRRASRIEKLVEGGPSTREVVERASKAVADMPDWKKDGFDMRPPISMGGEQAGSSDGAGHVDEPSPAAPGHIDWRVWVNERSMDSLDADMEGGDFVRFGEVYELAELLVRAERALYTDSLVGGEQESGSPPTGGEGSIPSGHSGSIPEPATPCRHCGHAHNAHGTFVDGTPGCGGAGMKYGRHGGQEGFVPCCDCPGYEPEEENDD